MYIYSHRCLSGNSPPTEARSSSPHECKLKAAFIPFYLISTDALSFSSLGESVSLSYRLSSLFPLADVISFLCVVYILLLHGRANQCEKNHDTPTSIAKYSILTTHLYLWCNHKHILHYYCNMGEKKRQGLLELYIYIMELLANTYTYSTCHVCSTMFFSGNQAEKVFRRHSFSNTLISQFRSISHIILWNLNCDTHDLVITIMIY